LNILFTFSRFEQLTHALKNRGCPEFTDLNYIFFIIQHFWATCACPEKQSYPGIIHCIKYSFYIQNFWATCACPEIRVCPEIFQARGGGLPPEPPPRTPMGKTYLLSQHAELATRRKNEIIIRIYWNTLSAVKTITVLPEFPTSVPCNFQNWERLCWTLLYTTLRIRTFLLATFQYFALLCCVVKTELKSAPRPIKGCKALD